jgi:CDP-glycerol glycerophosphotransferase (TagB/SpsB family)
VRFSHLTHIQLLHGDSDKPPSYNPVTTMFDKIYVAGQAGIDRYAANGVHIPAEKFTVVGRPQVESIAVEARRIGDIRDRTVLYAPTWVGYFTDSCHCSLPIGDRIIAALLARGARVVLRPHPYSARDPESARQVARMEQMLAADHAATGRDHAYGERASTVMSIVDCMNAADAMISDVSSVASDFLYSGKPFALTDMLNDGPAYVTGFPLARAAYVLRHDAANLDGVLDDLLEADPLAFTRQGMKEYYLGDFPGGSYADAFFDAVRAELGTGTTGSLPAAFVPARSAAPDEPAVVP